MKPRFEVLLPPAEVLRSGGEQAEGARQEAAGNRGAMSARR